MLHFIEQRRMYLLLIASVIMFIPLAIWAGWVIHWYGWGRQQALAKQRNYLLHHADHARIVKEGRNMLADPGKYPYRSGEPYPPSLPPYLASLNSSSVSVAPDHEVVILTFQREFQLFVAGEDVRGVPQMVDAFHPPAREIHPGLWYIELGGH